MLRGKHIELRLANRGEQPVGFLQRALGLAGQQEGDGFGEKKPDERDGDGTKDGRPKQHRLPAKGRQMAGDDETGERCADRITGLEKADRKSAVLFRGIFGGQGGHAGQYCTNADADDEAAGDQFANRCRDARSEHRGGHHHERGEDQFSPAESIGERGDEQAARGHARQPRAEHHAQAFGADLPVARQCRGDVREDEHVHAVEHVKDETGGNDQYLPRGPLIIR